MLDERIDPTDLEKWRVALARRDAAELYPDGFTGQEIIDAFLNFYRVAGEVFEDYELEEDAHSISPYSGKVAIVDKS